MAVKKKAVASKKSQSSKKGAAKPSKATAKTTTAKKATVKASVSVVKKSAPAPAKKAKPSPAAVKSAAPAPAAVVSRPASRPVPAVKTKDTDNDAALADITPYDIKSGEEYMNESQVKHFRNILKSWKRELMEEVDRTVHHMQDEAANFPDPNDRATQESEFTMELRARDRERKLIRKIEESISKLDAGEYGYCEQCGVEIGVRRLEARPTATLCIDCKTLAEIKEKHVNS